MTPSPNLADLTLAERADRGARLLAAQTPVPPTWSVADSWQRLLSAAELSLPCPELLLQLPHDPPADFNYRGCCDLRFTPFGSVRLVARFFCDVIPGVGTSQWRPASGDFLFVPLGVRLYLGSGPSATQWKADCTLAERRLRDLDVALYFCRELERELAEARTEAGRRNAEARPDPTA